MKTTLPLALLFAAVIGAGVWLAYFQGQSSLSPTTVEPSVTASTTSATTTSYTAAEVAQHATQSSCWTSINGNVYDVTSFIPEHPGGEGRILSICGKDGTAAFEGQHAYSSHANSILATLKIGTLAP